MNYIVYTDRGNVVVTETWEQVKALLLLDLVTHLLKLNGSQWSYMTRDYKWATIEQHPSEPITTSRSYYLSFWEGKWWRSAEPPAAHDLLHEVTLTENPA